MSQHSSFNTTSKASRKFNLLLFFLLGAFIGTIVLFSSLVIYLLVLKEKYAGKVLPGVYAFSVEVSGKNSQELDVFLEEKNRLLVDQKIVFFEQVNPAKSWEISPAEFDFSIDLEKMKKELLDKGKARSGVYGLAETFSLIVSPQVVERELNYNEEKLNRFIDKVSKEVDLPAKDALFEFKNGKATSFQISEKGLLVDRETLKSLTVSTFSLVKIPVAEKIYYLNLPVKEIEPKIKSTEANKLGVIELLAEGESSFKDSIPSRVHNIGLASSRLHGIVIPPGEVFSFGKSVGDISAETGYEKAYVIKENKTILEDGGGVCQVSTTMFRAALNAGLPIVERQAHYYRVGFYEQGGYPVGMDATVYPPSPDFKFKNDTSAHILIQTVVDKSKKKLKFQFYGTSDGRKVEISKPVIHSQTPPPPDVYADDPTLPAGVVKRFDVAHWGAKVSFVRKVFNADGRLKEERTFWSDYNAWPAVYQRGTGN